MQYGTPGMPLVTGGSSAGLPIQQPVNVFRYGEQALWSTYFWTATEEIANNSYRYFSAAIGDVGQGSVRVHSIAETNLKISGAIPQGVAYDAFAIATQFLAQDAASDDGNQDVAYNADGAGAAGFASIGDMVNMLNSGSLAWDFTQTTVDIAPLHLIGAGGGLFGAYAVDDAGAGAEANSGSAGNGPGSIWMYRKHPVALPGNTTFGILLNFGSRAEAILSTSATIGLRVVIFGYFKNVIEIG